MTTPVGEPLGLRGTEQWRRRSRSSPRSSLALFSFASRMCSPTNCWLWCSCSSTFCSGCMHLTHVPLRFRFAVHWGRFRGRNKWTGRIRRSQMVVMSNMRSSLRTRSKYSLVITPKPYAGTEDLQQAQWGVLCSGILSGGTSSHSITSVRRQGYNPELCPLS